MTDELRDANLELLVGIKRHLDEADRLRTIYNRLLSLAGLPSPQPVSVRHQPANRPGPEGEVRCGR